MSPHAVFGLLTGSSSLLLISELPQQCMLLQFYFSLLNALIKFNFVNLAYGKINNLAALNYSVCNYLLIYKLNWEWADLLELAAISTFPQTSVLPAISSPPPLFPHKFVSALKNPGG